MADPVHVFHALDRARIQPVTVRDEKHGAIMAHGYAKATGRPGVCAATTGPGATNLVTGSSRRSKSSVPVIALVQETPRRLVGKHAASEIDQPAALAPVSKWIGRIVEAATGGRGHARRLPHRDIGPARPRGGAVPRRCDGTDGRGRGLRRARLRSLPVLPEPGEPRVDRRRGRAAGGGAAPDHRRGRRRDPVPGLGAARGAGRDVRHSRRDDHDRARRHRRRASAERGCARQLDRAAARPRAASPTACWPTPTSRFIVGSRTGQIVTSDWTLPRRGTRVIHLDVDPVETGRNIRTDVAMIGDARETLIDLRRPLPRAEDPARGRDHGSLSRRRCGPSWRRPTEPLATSDAVPIQPERLLREISRVVDARTLIAADASYITGWALSHVRERRPGLHVHLAARDGRPRLGLARGHRGQARRSGAHGDLPHRATAASAMS